MKNVKILLAVVAVGVFLTGCGKKETLTCTNTQTASGVSMDQKVEVTFNGKDVEYIKMNVDSKATTDVIKKNWSVFASTLDKQYPNEDKNGIKVTTKNNKDKYTYDISIEIDLNKADKKSLSKYNLGDIANAKGSLKEVKESAEKSGFTCK